MNEDEDCWGHLEDSSRQRDIPRVISDRWWLMLLKVRTNSSILNGILISFISSASLKKSSTPPSTAHYPTLSSHSTHLSGGDY